MSECPLKEQLDRDTGDVLFPQECSLSCFAAPSKGNQPKKALNDIVMVPLTQTHCSQGPVC